MTPRGTGAAGTRRRNALKAGSVVGLALLGLALGTLAGAVGACDAVVGGECLPGYAASEGQCLAPGSGGGGSGGNGGSAGSGGTASSGGASSAGGSGGTECTPPLVECPDGCVDLLIDPFNCGACGNACATEICEQGKCTGEPTGHLIVVGMSFAQYHSPAQRLLGNALFLRPDDPVRIVDYRKYASAGATTNVDAAVEAEGAARGRTYALKTEDSAAEIAVDLASGTYDVFLVHDQISAPNGVLQAFGGELATAVGEFAKNGGTVVVLASAGPADMASFLTSSGILATSALTSATGSAVLNVAPNDVIGVGVPSPFLAKPATATITSGEAPGPLLTHVFIDKATTLPIAVHKVALK